MAETDQPQSRKHRIDRRSLGVVVLLGALSLGLIVGAWAMARNAPASTVGLISAVPDPRVSATQGCASFAQYWLDASRGSIDPVAIELFTNCRVDDRGNWVAAETMYGAAPLDESTLTPEQQAELQDLRGTIGQQIDGLEAELPGSIRSAFNQLHSPWSNAVVGHFREGVPWSSYRTRYARIVNAYLLDPQNTDLANYAGWIMSRKIEGYAAFRQQCLAKPEIAMLQTACIGMEDNLSIRYAPLPWELRDPDLLDTWFYETHVKPSQTEQG